MKLGTFFLAITMFVGISNSFAQEVETSLESTIQTATSSASNLSCVCHSVSNYGQPYTYACAPVHTTCVGGQYGQYTYQCTVCPQN